MNIGTGDQIGGRNCKMDSRVVMYLGLIISCAVWLTFFLAIAFLIACMLDWWTVLVVGNTNL